MMDGERLMMAKQWVLKACAVVTSLALASGYIVWRSESIRAKARAVVPAQQEHPREALSDIEIPPDILAKIDRVMLPGSKSDRPNVSEYLPAEITIERERAMFSGSKADAHMFHSDDWKQALRSSETWTGVKAPRTSVSESIDDLTGLNVPAQWPETKRARKRSARR